MEEVSLAQPDLLISFVWGREKKWSGTLKIEFLCSIPPILRWVLIGEAFPSLPLLRLVDKVLTNSMGLALGDAALLHVCWALNRQLIVHTR